MQKSLTEQISDVKQSPDSSPTRLHRLFDLAWQYQMADIPEWATFLGYTEHNDRWTDRSPEAYRHREFDLKVQFTVLQSIRREELETQDRLSYDLFGRMVEEDLISSDFGAEFLTITQMDGVQQEIPRALERMRFNTDQQRNQFLTRLERVPAAFAQTTALLTEGINKGITQPREQLRGLPEQINNLITIDPADSPLLVGLRKKPDQIDDQVWEKFRQSAFSLVAGEIRLAIENFRRFLTDDYLPASRTEIALSSLPRGREWYEFLTRKNTTTEMTPEQVFKVGLAEVARIRAEMNRVIESSGFKGDFAAFTDFLRTDPQFYFTEPADLLRAYRDIAKRVDPELVKFFGVLPRLPYGVTPIQPFMEKQQTTAYYMPGSAKAGRPGYFYANTYSLASRPKWEMEALTLHEAVPGHHLQIAIAQELEGIPEFRRESWITAYGEGWALYSESLGEQMGFYADPYAKFGQLTFEMWRAVRLVVDPGMHVKGWSREQAIDYFMQNSSKSRHDIEVEIDRYIVWPGQAVSYKIGELHIRELRRKAEKSLGEKFDLRSFHDELLKYGCVPLTTLTEIIDRWILSRQ